MLEKIIGSHHIKIDKGLVTDITNKTLNIDGLDVSLSYFGYIEDGDILDLCTDDTTPKRQFEIDIDASRIQDFKSKFSFKDEEFIELLHFLDMLVA